MLPLSQSLLPWCCIDRARPASRAENTGALASEHVNKPNTQAHDRAAQAEVEFETVFLANYNRVYGVLFRLLGSQAEAEDLALETFWKYWQRPPSRQDNLAGWLYRVATNLGYNALRAAKRRVKYEEEAGRDALDLAGPRASTPEAEAERRAERLRTRHTLERLGLRDAQILVLRHSGLATGDRQAIGVSPNSVGTLLARAEKEFERLYHETPD